jgi:hypothetical protein
MSGGSYDGLGYDVEREIYQLKSYAVHYRDGSMDKCYTPYDYATATLRAAMVKDQVQQFVPVREQFEIVGFTVPATAWDHIKLLLPANLRFGWLSPRYKRLEQRAVNRTEITLNSYSVYVAPNDYQIVVDKMPNMKLNSKYFREVRSL